MSPADAIAASRIGVAIDESYPPLIFYCSLDPISRVRRHLCDLGQSARARSIKHLVAFELGDAPVKLVPIHDAEKTSTWEPVAPKTVIDYLADLAQR